MSAPIHPGRLIPNFGVQCGMCKSHTISGGINDRVEGMAHTKAQANRALNGCGWAFTRAWGWICPTCNRFGSAGVVPEPASQKTPPLKPQELPK